MCGAAVPRTFFSRFTAGRGQAFARGVHAKSILSSERQQVAIGLSVQAIKREGGPIEEVRAGDVVWFAPGEKHWHGASPTTAMSHIAVQEKLNGSPVDWMEHVTDQQYQR
jgi:hypothetical protein